MMALASASVTSFPPLSLYCGSGGYTASGTDVLGAFAVNGDATLSNFGGGSSLSPPYGESDDSPLRSAFASESRHIVVNSFLRLS